MILFREWYVCSSNILSQYFYSASNIFAASNILVGSTISIPWVIFLSHKLYFELTNYILLQYTDSRPVARPDKNRVLKEHIFSFYDMLQQDDGGNQ